MGCNEGKSLRTDRRAIRTHRAIQDAYRTLVIREGLDKVTISAVAREADIDRKTFYLHYSSLDKVAEERRQMMSDRIVRVLTANSEPDGINVNIRAIVVELANILQEDPEFFRCVLGKITIESLVEALCDPVCEAVLEKEPTTLAPDAERTNYLVRYFLAGSLAVALHWFLTDSDTPIDEIADRIQALTRRGRIA